mgnify:CR=1 FL=1
MILMVSVQNLAEALEVDGAGVGRVAGDDHLGPGLFGHGLDDAVVELLRVGIETIGDEIVELCGKVDGAAVGEMPPLIEAKATGRPAARNSPS